MAKNQTQDQLTDDELDAIEAEKAERTEEITQAVAEAVANTRAEMEASIADVVAKAVAKAVADVKASTAGGTGSTASDNDNRPKDGIYDPNPKKAKLARDRSDTKQVIALERGYYGVELKEEGAIFYVPVDEVADWFEDVKGGKTITNAEDELV